MRRAALVVLLLAVCAPSRAAEPEAAAKAAAQGFQADFASRHAGGGSFRGVDLSAQFVDGNRDQGKIGDCHDFAAVALLETSWKRQTGNTVELSPADLFLQETALSGNFDSGMLQHFFSDYVTGGRDAPGEGGSAAQDVAFALGHGVAYERTLPYPQLDKVYTQGIRPFIEAEMAKADADADATNKANHIDPNMKVKLGDQTWTVAQLRREEAVQLDVGDAETSFIKSLLAAREPALEKDRAETRAVLAQFTPVVKKFPMEIPKSYLSRYMADAAGYAQKKGDSVDAHDLSGQDCSAASSLQRQFLLEQLDAGRPVAVGYDLTNGGPAAKDAPRSGHAIAVYKYDRDRRTGELVFMARNSWGADTPRIDIPAHRLCRIHEAVALKVPSDPR